MIPICPRCHFTFAYSAVEQYLHAHTGEPLPAACRLCRLLGKRHAIELSDATREPKATGWGKVNAIQKAKHGVAPPTPRQAPAPRTRPTFPKATPLARLYAQVGDWMAAHAGRVPMAHEFRTNGRLPAYMTIRRRFGSLAAFYAALDAACLPGCAAQYTAQLRARRLGWLQLSVPEYRRQYYARHKTQGLCVTCTRPATVDGGKTLTRCDACRAVQKQRAVRRAVPQEVA